MRSCWIRVGFNPMTSVLLRRRKFEHVHREGNAHRRHRNRHTREFHVMMEAQSGVTHPQGEKYQGFLAAPEARKRQGRVLSYKLRREHGSASTASDLQHCERERCCCCKPPSGLYSLLVLRSYYTVIALNPPRPPDPQGRVSDGVPPRDGRRVTCVDSGMDRP